MDVLVKQYLPVTNREVFFEGESYLIFCASKSCGHGCTRKTIYLPVTDREVFFEGESLQTNRTESAYFHSKQCNLNLYSRLLGLA